MKTQALLYPFLPHDHNFSFSVFSSPDIPSAHHHLCSPKGKKEYCQGFIPFFSFKTRHFKSTFYSLPTLPIINEKYEVFQLLFLTLFSFSFFLNWLEQQFTATLPRQSEGSQLIMVVWFVCPCEPDPILVQVRILVNNVVITVTCREEKQKVWGVKEATRNQNMATKVI